MSSVHELPDHLLTSSVPAFSHVPDKSAGKRWVPSLSPLVPARSFRSLLQQRQFVIASRREVERFPSAAVVRSLFGSMPRAEEHSITMQRGLTPPWCEPLAYPWPRPPPLQALCKPLRPLAPKAAPTARGTRDNRHLLPLANPSLTHPLTEPVAVPPAVPPCAVSLPQHPRIRSGLPPQGRDRYWLRDVAALHEEEGALQGAACVPPECKRRGIGEGV